MNKVPMVLAMALTLAFAGYAEAAKPKKRTRNANRVGAYGAALATASHYKGNKAEDEAELVNILTTAGYPTQNVTSSSKMNDVGYQLAFGYRFNRYVAAELGLAQYGELSSVAKGQLDAGNGFVPASVKLSFNVGGPVLSAVGILPINDKFEFFARGGILFANAERQISSRIDGQNAGFGSAKGDTTQFVYAVGASFNFNQVYSMRLEYQKIGEVGERNRTGTEELDIAAIGLVIRF